MKKILLSFILSLSVLTLLVGCKKDNREVIKIGYWVNNSNERTNNEYIFDAFEKRYPGYQIEPVAVTYDTYGEEIPRMFIGNTIPDVFWIREEYLPAFVNKGIVENMEPYLGNDPDLDLSLYFANAIEFCKYQNKIYALPRDVGAQVMAFNRDLMQGEPLPDNDWNWNDMVALGQKLTIKDGDVITRYGLGWIDWQALVHMNGGQMFSSDGKVAQFNTTNVVNALQFYSDLANVYGVMPTAEASQGIGNPFTGKMAAFAVVGPWDFSRLKKLNINYDIRPIPKGLDSADGKVRLSGLQIGISTKSKNKEMAYELVKFLSYDQEAQSLLAQYSIAMPAIKSIAQSELYTKSEYAPASMDIYFDILENRTFIVDHFEGEITALAEFGDWLYKIYNNADGTIVKAETIKDEMNAAIQAVLDE
jgi:multiple sugar transport system substrate-binding protein